MRTCQDCYFNEAEGEPMKNTGYCDIFDWEMKNSDPRPCNCNGSDNWAVLE